MQKIYKTYGLSMKGSKSKLDVQIEDNSVIICDIPYIGTNEYVNGGDNFDHERFYEWRLKQ